MGCRCNEAAETALTEDRPPRLEDAYPDTLETFGDDFASPDLDKVFRAGMQTGLLWAAKRAVKKGYNTHGHRMTGVIGAAALKQMSAQVTEDARERASS